MLSFNSLIFTIFAVIAIWKGFSFLSKLNQGTGISPAKSEPPGQPPKAEAGQQAIELVPCRRCGSYVDPKQGCHCATSSS